MNENSYTLSHFWSQGDGVSHAVALLLLAMSLASWSVMLVKSWRLLQLRRMTLDSREFWHSDDFTAAIKQLGAHHNNPFLHLARRGSDAAAHHGEHRDELHGVLNLSDWLESSMNQAMDDIARHMQRGLSLLASVGSTAPFIGLFGTVWGIYHALASIGNTGVATLDKVAGPVGEALIMTALGLVVAIPAVLSYNALTRANREVFAQVRRFAHDLHAYLITGGVVRKGCASAAREL